MRIVRVCGDVPKWIGDGQRLTEGVVCVRSRGVTRICLLGDAQQILIGIVTIGSSVTELVSLQNDVAEVVVVELNISTNRATGAARPLLIVDVPFTADHLRRVGALTAE